MTASKNKRETTRWKFRVNFKGDTYVRVGRIYNNSDERPDIVRYQVKSSYKDGCADFACTVDEAATFASGLLYVVASELVHRSAEVRRMFR